MPVSLSKIFDIQGRVIAPVSTGVSLDICALSESDKLPASCVLMFSDYKEVVTYFGNYTDPECVYANIYFKGFDGGIKKPSKLLMSRFVDKDIAASMLSQPLPSLDEIKAEGTAECEFHITKLDGTLTTVAVKDIDLANVVSYTSLATTIKTAINTETSEQTVEVTYNNLQNSFLFSTQLVGDTAQILAATYPTGGTQKNLAEILGIADPALLSQGSAARTPAQNIDHVINCTSDFAGFVFFFSPTSEDTLVSTAQHLDTLKEDYSLFLRTKDPNALVKGETTSLRQKVRGYKNVFVQWGSIDTNVFASSIGACVDYTNGTALNWSFKKQSGLTTDVTTDSMYDALVANEYNFYATYGLKAMNDDFLYNGNITGIYNFVDALYNSIWLKDSLQRDLLLLFTSIGQISYTQQGYTLIRSALQNTIDQALANNVISIGVILSSQQKIQIEQEFGEDLSTTLETNGYILIIQDPGAEVRIKRESPICTLLYTYGGGINRIVLESIQIQ